MHIWVFQKWFKVYNAVKSKVPPSSNYKWYSNSFSLTPSLHYYTQTLKRNLNLMVILYLGSFTNQALHYDTECANYVHI